MKVTVFAFILYSRVLFYVYAGIRACYFGLDQYMIFKNFFLMITYKALYLLAYTGKNPVFRKWNEKVCCNYFFSNKFYLMFVSV